MSVSPSREPEVQDRESEKDAAPAAGGERVRALDFSQPTKFTTELRRRIGRALDPFCDALGTWMSGELRADVELGVTEIGQHTWAAAKARLPADAIAVDVVAESISRHMLLSVERPLVLQSLECLLGGDAAHAPTERHLTEIDWVLTRGAARLCRGRALDSLGGHRRPRADPRPGRHRGRRRGVHADRRTDPVGDAALHDRRPLLGDIAADPLGRDRARRGEHARRRQPAARLGPARGGRASPRRSPAPRSC